MNVILRGSTLRLDMILITLGLLCSLSSPSIQAQEVTIEQIQEQWKQRGESFPAFHFLWKATNRVSLNGLDKDPNAPHVEKIIQFERSLLFDRGSIRLVNDGEFLREVRGREHFYRPVVLSRTWNGTFRRECYDYEGEYPLGQITRDSDHCFNDPTFNWILRAFCVECPSAIDLSRYHLADKSRANESGNVVLLKHGDHSSGYDEIWVQAKSPHLLTKAILKENDLPISWFDIGYQIDPETKQMIPKTSKYVTLTSEGKFMNETESEIVMSNLAPKVSPADFVLSFPVGCKVNDLSQDHKETYIQREDGKKRFVTVDEIRRKATYEELLNTESGQAGLNRKP